MRDTTGRVASGVSGSHWGSPTFETRPFIYMPSQGTALLINVYNVMGKLLVAFASYGQIRLGQDVVRRVTLRTRPGEAYMLRQTHGNAVTSRNEAGNRSTPGGGPE